MVSLYRRVLGEAFDRLPPVLRRFHDRPSGGPACAVLNVTRGKGRLRNGLAALMRLPAQGSAVPVRLRVMVEGDRERWVRDFPDVRLETTQWARGGLLIEAAGPLRFGCRLVVDGEEMRFQFVRGWLFAIPLPSALAIRTNALVRARPESWLVRVWVEAPVFGLLVEYEGEVTPQ